MKPTKEAEALKKSRYRAKQKELGLTKVLEIRIPIDAITKLDELCKKHSTSRSEMVVAIINLSHE